MAAVEAALGPPSRAKAHFMTRAWELVVSPTTIQTTSWPSPTFYLTHSLVSMEAIPITILFATSKSLPLETGRARLSRSPIVVQHAKCMISTSLLLHLMTLPIRPWAGSPLLGDGLNIFRNSPTRSIILFSLLFIMFDRHQLSSPPTLTPRALHRPVLLAKRTKELADISLSRYHLPNLHLLVAGHNSYVTLLLRLLAGHSLP